MVEMMPWTKPAFCAASTAASLAPFTSFFTCSSVRLCQIKRAVFPTVQSATIAAATAPISILTTSENTHKEQVALVTRVDVQAYLCAGTN